MKDKWIPRDNYKVCQQQSAAAHLKLTGREAAQVRLSRFTGSYQKMSGKPKRLQMAGWVLPKSSLGCNANYVEKPELRM